MTVLILTPVFKEAEDGVNPIFWMGFQMTVDGDIAPVPNLFGQVGGVEDELGLKEGVFATLGEESEVEGQLKSDNALFKKPE
jgi:hypothetical protein